MHCNMIDEAQTERPSHGGLSEIRSGALRSGGCAAGHCGYHAQHRTLNVGRAIIGTIGRVRFVE